MSVSPNTLAIDMAQNRARLQWNSSKKYSPYKQYDKYKAKPGANTIDDAVWVGHFETYVKHLGSIGFCSRFNKSIHGTTKKKCNCLQNLGNDDFPRLRRSVAHFCYNFAKKSGDEKKYQLIDWIRLSKVFSKDVRGRNYQFAMPIHYVHAVEAGSADDLLCKDAILRLCGVGEHVWNSVNKTLKNNVDLKMHGLKGKVSNSSFKDGSIEKERLLDHFYTLEGLAEVRATRFVRKNEIYTSTRCR